MARTRMTGGRRRYDGKCARWPPRSYWAAVRPSMPAVSEGLSGSSRPIPTTASTSSTAPASMPICASGVHHDRSRQHRSLDRRPRRGAHAVRRHAGLDLQLRVRDPAREAAERRPLLLPERTAGLHFGTELENNTFANGDAQHRRDASAGGRLLDARPGSSRSIRRKQFTGLRRRTADADPTGGESRSTAVESPRWSSATIPPRRHRTRNYLHYTGDEHVVLGGTAGNDILIAGDGDDTL